MRQNFVHNINVQSEMKDLFPLAILCGEVKIW